MKTKAEWKREFQLKLGNHITYANVILFDLFGYNLKSPSRSDDVSNVRNAIDAIMELENEKKAFTLD